MRIGFKAPVHIGSVIAAAVDCSVSCTAKMPLSGRSNQRLPDWTPAERLAGGAVSHAEADRDEIVVLDTTWAQPRVRSASRTWHAPADPKYAGWLGAALVLPDRLTNIAPQAMIVASERDEAAGKDHRFQG